MNFTRIALGVLISSIAAFASFGGINTIDFADHTPNAFSDGNLISGDNIIIEDMIPGYEYSSGSSQSNDIVSVNPHPSDNIVILESTCDIDYNGKMFYVDLDDTRIMTCSRETRNELRNNPESFMSEIEEELNEIRKMREDSSSSEDETAKVEVCNKTQCFLI